MKREWQEEGINMGGFKYLQDLFEIKKNHVDFRK